MIMLLFIALIVLCSVDVVSTMYGLKLGKVTELNPVIHWLMDKIGVVPALIGTKVIFLAVVWMLLWNLLVILILNGIYIAVCVNNVKVLLKVKNDNGS